MVELAEDEGEGAVDRTISSEAAHPFEASRCEPAVAEAVARRINRRASARLDGATDTADHTIDLPALLETGDLARFDPEQQWPRRSEVATMRVPIGCTSDGQLVHLDL